MGATLTRAKQRTIGTLLGVAVGSMLAILTCHSLLATAICTAILVFTCVLVRAISHILFVFIVTIIAMILLNAGQTPNWDYAIYRMLDTLLGVSIGLAASFALWPNWARLQLNQTLSHAIHKTDELCCLVIDALITQQPNRAVITPLKLELENLLDKNRQFLQQATQELTLSTERIIPSLAIVNNLEKIQALLHTCHMLSDADLELKQPEHFQHNFLNIKAHVHEAFLYCRNRLDYPHEKHERHEIKDLLSHLTTTPEIPCDRSLASRFLHRQINLLSIEMNHLVQSIEQLRPESQTPQAEPC
jgi:uncharacterized membrane protein YccC